MRNRAIAKPVAFVWNRLRSNYWFIPALVIALCFGLAYLVLTLDEVLPHRSIMHLSWVYTRDPEGARQLLSVISQSMITVAGVVFSVMVVALTMASNQFGTRVLKSFARDRGNQVVLGIFLGTFLYGLVVMRRVESAKQVFVPSLSVATGIFLACVSVIVLVFFIHHVIVEMQAENVIAAVARDLSITMDDLFPEAFDSRQVFPRPPKIECAMNTTARPAEVHSHRAGYVSAIDEERLLHLAVRHQAVIRMAIKAGDFVGEQALLAELWCDKDPERTQRALQRAISVGPQRTYEDDIAFGLEQLGFIAVRSLSPAINAVGTALDALKQLMAALIRLGGRKIPSPYLHDDDGKVRVIMQGWNLQTILDGVLDPLRTAGAGNPSLIAAAMRGLARAGSQVANPDLRRILLIHFERFARAGSEFPEQQDRDRLRELYEHLQSRPAA